MHRKFLNVNGIVVMLCLSTTMFAQQSSTWKQLTISPENDYHPRWDHSGDMIAYTHNTCWSTDIYMIDPDEGLPEIVPIKLEGDKHFDWSPDDTRMVFDARIANGPPNIFMVDVDGENLEQITMKGGFHPAWSPNFDMIAFSSLRSGNVDIWIMDISTRELSRLTHNQKSDYHPCWSNNGKYISFTSERSGNPDIWIVPAKGGTPVQITTNQARDDWASWSPDDSYLIYASKRSGNYDLWLTTRSSKKTKQITYSKSNENHPEWSPEGKRLAFTSDRSGNLDIWIISFN